MLIGYARVSTNEQNPDLQLDALKKAGCETIYQDRISGTKTNRPGLGDALEHLRPGDTLVVWKLDRLGRSLKHLIDVITTLHDRHVAFRSIQESLDTGTNGGKLIFHIFGALAEFERGLILERTRAGLESARARGRFGGRPRVMNDEQIAMARAMMNDKSTPVKEICRTLGVSKATLYRYLKGSS